MLYIVVCSVSVCCVCLLSVCNPIVCLLSVLCLSTFTFFYLPNICCLFSPCLCNVFSLSTNSLFCLYVSSLRVNCMLSAVCLTFISCLSAFYLQSCGSIYPSIYYLMFVYCGFYFSLPSACSLSVYSLSSCSICYLLYNCMLSAICSNNF